MLPHLTQSVLGTESSASGKPNSRPRAVTGVCEHRVSFFTAPTLFSKTGFLEFAGWLDWQTSKLSRGSYHWSTSVPESYAHLVFMGAGDQNSGPHACMADHS